MTPTLLLLAGLYSGAAHAANVLYCVDATMGTDAMADALAASGHTVTTDTDVEGTCDTAIGTAAYDLVVVSLSDSAFSMPNLDAWMIAGMPTIDLDRRASGGEAVWTAYGISPTGVNLSTLGSFDASVSTGLPGTIALTNPGWSTVYSASFTSSVAGTSLAAFEDGYSGAMQFGDVIIQSVAPDAADSSQYTDMVQFFANEVTLLAGVATDMDGDGHDDVAYGGDDCDDSNAAVHPGAGETWYDGIDGNCDGWSDYDQDRDGYDTDDSGGTDCNDTNSSINPGATEVADGIDNDCDGTVDGGSPGDADGDGLSDADELIFGSNPNDADSDGDGMDDSEEYDTGTDPWDRDTDDDGLSDGAEYNVYFCDPLVRDTDGDSLGDALEVGRNYKTDYTAGNYFVPDADTLTTTDPNDADTDDDGLKDSTEDANHDGAMTGSETDPTLIDTDMDDVQDGTELGLAAAQTPDTDASKFVADADPSTTTDPLERDSDGGTAADGTEDLNHDGKIDSLECDPNDGTDDQDCSDDDHDGLSAAEEAGYGTDPLNPDSDGDGIEDGIEVFTSTDPAKADTDGDGLADGAEDANRSGEVDAGETDPRTADTDGGGVPDGVEKWSGADPLDPADDVVDSGEEPSFIYAGRGCDATGTPAAFGGLLLGLAAISARRRGR